MSLKGILCFKNECYHPHMNPIPYLSHFESVISKISFMRFHEALKTNLGISFVFAVNKHCGADGVCVLSWITEKMIKFSLIHHTLRQVEKEATETHHSLFTMPIFHYLSQRDFRIRFCCFSRGSSSSGRLIKLKTNLKQDFKICQVVKSNFLSLSETKWQMLSY